MVCLTETGKEALGMVLEAMKSVCQVYEADFWELLDLHELLPDEELRRGVDLVLCDTSYKIQRQKDFPILGHNSFSLEDATVFDEFLKDVLCPGLHGHNMCSALNLEAGTQKVTKDMEEVEALDGEDA